ncbi:MAG: glutamine-hydrolyzing GMP synthase [Candidatus Bilamarchaeaceae archaeon]
MIVIVDNGSQYTHLIKRNLRDLEYPSDVLLNRSAKLPEIEARKPEAIILSGGPSSVTKGENFVSEEIVKKIASGWSIPLLGICYGHQLIAHALGGKVARGKCAEYGLGKVVVDDEDLLFRGIPKEFTAWVSHFDEVKERPPGFACLAHSEICAVEAMRHREKRIFGTQFHPEVWHTEYGELMLKNFLSSI